jgi:hypothetical protein
VLCTVSEDAHDASSHTVLGSDAYSEAAARWQHALRSAPGRPPRHASVTVRYLPLGIEWLGGCGFTLVLSRVTRERLDPDLAAAAVNDVQHIRQVRSDMCNAVLCSCARPFCFAVHFSSQCLLQFQGSLVPLQSLCQ